MLQTNVQSGGHFRSARNLIRFLTFANFLSSIGDGATFIAVPLIASRLTDSAFSISLVRTVGVLPWLLFAPLAGAVIDRGNRAWILFYSQCIGAAVSLYAIAALSTNSKEMQTLIVFSFLITSAQVFFEVGIFSISPSLARSSDLEGVNSKIFLGQLLGLDLLGPIAGGWLAGVNTTAAFELDFLSFVVGAFLIIPLLRSSHRNRGSSSSDQPLKRHILREIWEGQIFLMRDTTLRRAALAMGTLNLCISADTAILVLFARHILLLGSVGYGLLLSTQGVIGALAAITSPRIARRYTTTTIFYTSLTIFALAMVAMSTTSSPITTAIAISAASGAGTIWNVTLLSTRQRMVPSEVLGRVNSTYRVLTWGILPIGALLGGILTDHFGLRSPFEASFIICTLLVSYLGITLFLGRRNCGRHSKAFIL